MVLAGVGQHFSRNFDQYTIMCVFGSVVGCVVLPLVAQSFESFIITAILLGVTVKTLNKNGGGTGGGVVREAQEERKKEKKVKKAGVKRHGSSQQQVQTIVDRETQRKQREHDLQRNEELKILEKERRFEEKREKKAKKREERLKKKEEERIEREREETALRERQKERSLRKKKKTLADDLSILPTMESVCVMNSDHKPLHRERTYSASSSTSSVSAHSVPSPSPHGRRRVPPPKRASSAPLMTSSSSPSPMPHPPPLQDSPPQVTSHPPTVNLPPPPRPCIPFGPQHLVPLQMMTTFFPTTFAPPVSSQPLLHPHFFHQVPSVPQNTIPPSHIPPDSIQRHTPSPIQFHPPKIHTSEAVGSSSPIADKPPSGHTPLQPAWLDTSPTTVMNRTSPSPRSPGSPGSSCSPSEASSSKSQQSVRHTLVSPSDERATPSLMGGCGTAQGFYSLLSEQALNGGNSLSPLSSQSSPARNIWSPPSADQTEEVGLKEWPSV